MDERLHRASLTHPFGRIPSVEADLDFALEGNARTGPLFESKSRQMRRMEGRQEPSNLLMPLRSHTAWSCSFVSQ
eukprot:909078-Karenia_brevis.AAC.1